MYGEDAVGVFYFIYNRAYIESRNFFKRGALFKEIITNCLNVDDHFLIPWSHILVHFLLGIQFRSFFCRST